MTQIWLIFADFLNNTVGNLIVNRHSKVIFQYLISTENKTDFVLGLLNQSCPLESPAPVTFASGSVPV